MASVTDAHAVFFPRVSVGIFFVINHEKKTLIFALRCTKRDAHEYCTIRVLKRNLWPVLSVHMRANGLESS